MMKLSSMYLIKINNPKGSALLMALFILVVLTLLGGALVQVLSTSSEAIAQEVIGTRALAAANSAMQGELQQLFPLNPVDDTDFQCNIENNYDFSTSGANSDGAGLYHCKAKTTCSQYATHPVDGTKFYRLTSTGTCGSGKLASGSQNIVVSSRTVQVEARTL